MKFESFFVAVLLLGGTELFVRVLSQGVESALVATAIEWSVQAAQEEDRWCHAKLNPIWRQPLSSASSVYRFFSVASLIPARKAPSNSLQPKFTELAVGLPQVPLALISLSPLSANGLTVGGIAVYDDPTTQRPADYLEVFDSKGALVVVSWFDRFGIERLVVDRALIEGGNELQGVLVTVLDGDSI